MEKERPLEGGVGAEFVTLAAKQSTALTIPTPEGKHKRIRAAIAKLSAEFPVIAEHQPLAIDIREVLPASMPGVSKKLIRRAIARHCRQMRYLEALAAGAPRYGLNGEVCGEVTPKQREEARVRLDAARVRLEAHRNAVLARRQKRDQVAPPEQPRPTNQLRGAYLGWEPTRDSAAPQSTEAPPPRFKEPPKVVVKAPPNRFKVPPAPTTPQPRPVTSHAVPRMSEAPKHLLSLLKRRGWHERA